MKRRDFFKKGATGVAGASLIPLSGNAGELPEDKGDRKTDKWKQMGTGNMDIPDRRKEVTYDVAVLGGGLAGMCAATAAARNGALVVLVALAFGGVGGLFTLNFFTVIGAPAGSLGELAALFCSTIADSLR